MFPHTGAPPLPISCTVSAAVQAKFQPVFESRLTTPPNPFSHEETQQRCSFCLQCGALVMRLPRVPLPAGT
jgi:hypothetical protein